MPTAKVARRARRFRVALWRIPVIASLCLVGLIVECSIALAGVKFAIEYDEVAIDVMKSEAIRHHRQTDYWIVGHNTFKYVDAYHIEHLVPLIEYMQRVYCLLQTPGTRILRIAWEAREESRPRKSHALRRRTR